MLRVYQYICSASDDSGEDETYRPTGDKSYESDDNSEPGPLCQGDVGHHGMVAEQYDEHGIMLDRLEDELPDPELSQDKLPDPDPNTNSSANKRRKVGINKPRKP